MERPLEKVLKKGDYIAIKCHNTPGDNDFGSYDIDPSEEDHLKSGLSGKTNYSNNLNGQSISTRPLRYTFTKCLLTGDAKAAVIGRCTS